MGLFVFVRLYSFHEKALQNLQDFPDFVLLMLLAFFARVS
jgi:hypothetical protein